MEQLMKVDEVAEILQIHEKTVKKWLREGKIQGIKLGKSWRIEKEELKEYLNKKKTMKMSKVKKELKKRVANLEKGTKFSVKGLLEDLWSKVPNPTGLGSWFINEVKNDNIKKVKIEDKDSSNLQWYTKL